MDSESWQAVLEPPTCIWSKNIQWCFQAIPLSSSRDSVLFGRRFACHKPAGNASSRPVRRFQARLLTSKATRGSDGNTTEVQAKIQRPGKNPNKPNASLGEDAESSKVLRESPPTVAEATLSTTNDDELRFVLHGELSEQLSTICKAQFELLHLMIPLRFISIALYSAFAKGARMPTSTEIQTGSPSSQSSSSIKNNGNSTTSSAITTTRQTLYSPDIFLPLISAFGVSTKGSDELQDVVIEELLKIQSSSYDDQSTSVCTDKSWKGPALFQHGDQIFHTELINTSAMQPMGVLLFGLSLPLTSAMAKVLVKIQDTLKNALVLEKQAINFAAVQAEQKTVMSHLSKALSGMLMQVRSPLGALTTFGKLLERRLPENDVNRDLAQNIIIQSERLQDLLLPLDHDRRALLPSASTSSVIRRRNLKQLARKLPPAALNPRQYADLTGDSESLRLRKLLDNDLAVDVVDVAVSSNVPSVSVAREASRDASSRSGVDSDSLGSCLSVDSGVDIVDMKELIQGLCKSARVVAIEKMVAFDFAIQDRNERGEPVGDFVCSGDRSVIQRAMAHLLDNAFHLTPAGGVVRIFLHQSSRSDPAADTYSVSSIRNAQHGHVVVTFLDSGYGVKSAVDVAILTARELLRSVNAHLELTTPSGLSQDPEMVGTMVVIKLPSCIRLDP